MTSAILRVRCLCITSPSPLLRKETPFLRNWRPHAHPSSLITDRLSVLVTNRLNNYVHTMKIILFRRFLFSPFFFCLFRVSFPLFTLGPPFLGLRRRHLQLDPLQLLLPHQQHRGVVILGKKTPPQLLKVTFARYKNSLGNIRPFISGLKVLLIKIGSRLSTLRLLTFQCIVCTLFPSSTLFDAAISARCLSRIRLQVITSIQRSASFCLFFDFNCSKTNITKYIACSVFLALWDFGPGLRVRSLSVNFEKKTPTIVLNLNVFQCQADRPGVVNPGSSAAHPLAMPFKPWHIQNIRFNVRMQHILLIETVQLETNRTQTTCPVSFVYTSKLN